MTYRCACSRPCCGKETVTHRSSACAAALALVALGTLPRCCGAEEARAAIRGPSAESRDRLSADGLLGALSFTAGREPITLSADALEFDYRSRVLTYKGG